MNIRNLFSMALAPADELNGGGGADPAAGSADPAAEPGAAAPSMEDTARETYRELMKAGTDVVDGEIVDGEGEDAGEQKAGRQRGPDGKFTKGAAPDGQQQQGKPDGEQPPVDPAAQPKPHDAYPNTWRKELASDWAKLPESVRQEVHKREQDFHNGVKQYRDAAGFGASIAQEMLPYQQLMRQHNVQPAALVRDIMGSLKDMVTGTDESKAATLLKLADQYRINLDTVLSLRQRAPGQAAPDLSPVLQRVDKLETRITQADQEREATQRAEDERIVSGFINDPKNEHAKTVSQEMSALLMSGQAKDLQDAYERACWLHPEVRSKLIAKQEADRRKKEADEATAARKAAAANVTRRGTPPAPTKAGSMEDTARATYRRLNGSG